MSAGKQNIYLRSISLFLPLWRGSKHGFQKRSSSFKELDSNKKGKPCEWHFLLQMWQALRLNKRKEHARREEALQVVGAVSFSCMLFTRSSGVNNRFQFVKTDGVLAETVRKTGLVRVWLIFWSLVIYLRRIALVSLLHLKTVRHVAFLLALFWK